MEKHAVTSDKLPEAMGPYSQCIVGKGSKFVFISGQVPEDPCGVLVGPGDIAMQTQQVMKNLKAAVEGAGGTIDDICKITIFLVSLDDAAYKILADIRKTFFKAPYPASTLIEVNRLAAPEWLIEIEAYAVLENEP